MVELCADCLSFCSRASLTVTVGATSYEAEHITKYLVKPWELFWTQSQSVSVKGSDKLCFLDALLTTHVFRTTNVNSALRIIRQGLPKKPPTIPDMSDRAFQIGIHLEH